MSPTPYLSGRDIAECLRILTAKSSKLMTTTYVLDFAGITAFTDECMDALVKLLHKYPRIVSINLGEKEKVSPTGWQTLVDGLRAPKSGVIAAWVDKVNAPQDTVEDVRAAIRQRRFEKEAVARSLLSQAEVLEGQEQLEMLKQATQAAPWRAWRVWWMGKWQRGVWQCVLDSKDPVDTWWSKPAWHPKCGWAAFHAVDRL